ncbi:hypothetical protein AB4160_16360 [Shewanella sp. 10N.286.51.B8]|uniref:hypothetical protein n=1 Tax=Shewanella sp. 10N.286.51.B8 TaxID=3229708 RepID=UPI003550CC71
MKNSLSLAITTLALSLGGCAFLNLVEGTSILGRVPEQGNNFEEVFQNIATQRSSEVKKISREFGTLEYINLNNILNHTRRSSRLFDDDRLLLNVLEASCSGTVFVIKPSNEKNHFLRLLNANLIHYPELDLNKNDIKNIFNTSKNNNYNNKEGSLTNIVDSYFVNVNRNSAHKSYYCIVNKEVTDAIWLGFTITPYKSASKTKYEYDDILVYLSKDQILDKFQNQLKDGWIERKIEINEEIKNQQEKAKEQKKAEEYKKNNFKKSIDSQKKVWENRLKNTYQIGDSVCSFKGNLKGNIEVISENRFKVFWHANASVYSNSPSEDGLFFGNFPYSYFDNNFLFQVRNKDINKFEWINKDKISYCTLHEV